MSQMGQEPTSADSLPQIGLSGPGHCNHKAQSQNGMDRCRSASDAPTTHSSPQPTDLLRTIPPFPAKKPSP